MSKKSLDRKGRWRSLTIAFRVSPEENESINTRAKLAGLTKQEYLIRRCQEQDVAVMGNPKVYKALKGQLELLLAELQRIAPGEAVETELQETIRLVANTIGGMEG